MLWCVACLFACLQVVLRGGLVAPWMAVPSLVAQLTDDLPETRATALKVRPQLLQNVALAVITHNIVLACLGVFRHAG